MFEFWRNDDLFWHGHMGTYAVLTDMEHFNYAPHP